MTRIVYIGNTRVPTSTESSYVWAFRKLGCEVVTVQQEEATSRGPAWLTQQARDAHADLVIYTRTHNHLALGLGQHGPSQWTAAWRRLETEGAKTASIHLDVFWGIPEREEWIGRGDPLFTTETVFTADGDISARLWEDAGVNHVWLPPAIDERNLLHEGEPLPTMLDVPPIVWVGSSQYHSEWPWRAELVAFLRSEHGDRLIEFGNGSPNGVCRDNLVLTELYSRDSIVVGDSMFSDGDGRYYSDRIPEVLGRRGLLVHPRLRDETQFCQYIDYQPYDLFDFDSLEHVIAYLTDNRDRRFGPKVDGCEAVRQGHTYTIRARAVLQHLDLLEKEPA